MARPGIPRKLAAWAHDFGRGVAIAGGVAMFLVLALVLSRSGVSGTISRSNCQPGLGNAQHCSIEPVSAAITVTRPTDNMTWKAKSDAWGNFRVDLPPGGYLLLGQDTLDNVWQTSFPVRAGQVTHVDLLLMRLYRSISGGICLASSDRIATPSGPIQVNQLRPGMLVWTFDGSGRRVAAPILVVSHVPAPVGHQVLRVVLADGRTVEVSAGHPTGTGRLVGTLRLGDLLDGSSVMTVESIPYADDTWDLLPAGPTGVYWANDVLLASTLRSQPLQLHAA
jgi:hypothetical protein